MIYSVKWGFADEVAAQLHSNNARFWAFEPHLSRVVNTDRGSQSFFGFYGINAASHLVDLADGKMESIQQALLAVKAQQTDCQALVVFWDNARSHKCLETWGWERRIFFVPLPPYSPEWSATAAEPDWAGLEIGKAVAHPNAICQRTHWVK